MRIAWGIVAVMMAASSAVTHAAEATAASPGQFANATSACFGALGAKEPADVLKVLESDGWKLHRTTSLGGVFLQDGVAIQLKVETVFSSRICTVLGNRDGSVPLTDSARLIETSLKAEHGDEIRRDEAGGNFTLIANEKYRAVISPAQSDRDFNTQITTIDI